MQKKLPILLVIPFVLAFIAGCGGTNHHTVANEVPVVVSIHDQPSNVGVVSFDVQITGACLLTSANATATSCSGAANLLTDTPVTVQLENLQTSQDSDVLGTSQVPADTYTNILITFGTETAAVTVDPGTTDTDTASPPNACTAAATPVVCNLSPGTPTSVNVPLTSPAVLTTGTPANISIDFDVADSLVETTVGTTNTFTITPTFSATDNPVGADGNLLDVGAVTGTVTSVGSGTFTVTDSATGQPQVITTGANTTFKGFGSCMAANLTCVQANQLVTVDSSFGSTSPLTQTATSVTDNSGITFGQGFEGTIIQNGVTPMVLVTSVPAGNTQNVTVGQTLTLVPPATSAGFSVALPAGQTLPAGVSFAAPTDLAIGQNVLIDSTGIATAGNVSTTTADQIVLEPTQFNGTVASLTSPNLTVNGLNNFFTDNSVRNVNVLTGTQTVFSGTNATTGFNGFAVGDQANFNGFMFNGAAGQPPVFFSEGILDNGVVPAAGVKAIR